MTTLTDLYNTRPTYGTNMPTIQPTASLYGTNMPSIPSEASMPGSSPEAASPILDQAGYFAQNPNAGFGDWLNYTQGKTAGGQFQAPDASSLPAGFMQSEYGPAWRGVLGQFSDPNYNRNEDSNNLSAWLTNAPTQFTAGRSLAEWAKPTTSANLIGGGAHALDAATVGQLALGGAAGAAANAGVGGSATGGGGAIPAVSGDVAGAAAPAAVTGTDIAGAGAAASAISPALTATQDPLGSGGDPGNPIGGSSGGAGGAAGSALSRIIDGTATTADWTSVLGGTAGTALGVAGSVSQQKAIQDLAKQQMAMGAPYRDRLASLYADPNSFLKSAEVTTPVQQGTDALARSLSVQGNPIGSGHALQELQDYSANQLFGRLGEEKNRLAGYGGRLARIALAAGTPNVRHHTRADNLEEPRFAITY